MNKTLFKSSDMTLYRLIDFNMVEQMMNTLETQDLPFEHRQELLDYMIDELKEIKNEDRSDHFKETHKEPEFKYVGPYACY